MYWVIKNDYFLIFKIIIKCSIKTLIKLFPRLFMLKHNKTNNLLNFRKNIQKLARKHKSNKIKIMFGLLNLEKIQTEEME